MTPRGIIFSDEDRAKLAAFDSGNEIRPGRILAEIDAIIDRGIMEGRFTREAADQDLECALMRAHACLNLHQYEDCIRALSILRRAEASAAGCGIFFYRLCAVWLHLGKIEEAINVRSVPCEKSRHIHGDGWKQQNCGRISAMRKVRSKRSRPVSHWCPVIRSSSQHAVRLSRGATFFSSPIT